MSMIQANNDNYQQEIFGDKEFKVVLFGASWCGPCRMYHPVVDAFAAAHPEIKLVANDVDVSTKAAEAFEISTVPTTVIMSGGAEVAREVGVLTPDVLADFVARHK